MKGTFKGYHQPTEEEFSQLWRNALFVFDTNVLLNLYRYQSATRDQLIEVIEKISENVWIPYHVGLEFQRNRLIVIAEQNKKFSEVKQVIIKAKTSLTGELESLQLKKRHSMINPDKLIDGISELVDEFLIELNELESNHVTVVSEDQLLSRIESIFNGKIGQPPMDQKEIDEITKEGDDRYKYSMPPGFQDDSKDKSKSDEFQYGGIKYKRKYGDLIIWKQIISFLKEKAIKDVILISDDSKSDWWWKIDSSGPKIIGPRPELVEEIIREAKVDNFYLYNSEGFLKYAKELLAANVSEATIDEVRQVSIDRDAINTPDRPARPSDTGTIIETMNSGGYTYINVLKEDGEDAWLAMPETFASVGDKIEYPRTPAMMNFTSNTLNKTFPKLSFLPGVRIIGTAE